MGLVLLAGEGLGLLDNTVGLGIILLVNIQFVLTFLLFFHQHVLGVRFRVQLGLHARTISDSGLTL